MCNYSGSLNVTGGKMSNNSAKLGGAAGALTGFMLVKGTDFDDNSAADLGGALYGYDMIVEDALFKNNKASKDGGAIFVGFWLTCENTKFSGNSTNVVSIGRGAFVEGDVPASEKTVPGSEQSKQENKAKQESKTRNYGLKLPGIGEAVLTVFLIKFFVIRKKRVRQQ